MSNRLFSPDYAQPKEQDPLLVQAPLKQADHGARAVTTSKPWKNDQMRVRHVGGRS